MTSLGATGTGPSGGNEWHDAVVDVADTSGESDSAINAANALAESGDWSERAKRLLTEALDQMGDVDVIAEVTEALTCLHLAQGEAPQTVRLDAAEYAERETEPDPECTCPPELRDGGGFKSTCPARGFGDHP